jgi:hypothetical protein
VFDPRVAPRWFRASQLEEIARGKSASRILRLLSSDALRKITWGREIPDGASSVGFRVEVIFTEELGY